MPDFTSHTAMHPALQAMILLAVAIAVVTDVRRRRIYNVLTFPTMALGLVLNAVIDGPRGLLLSLVGLVLGAVLFVIPMVAWGRGAGDLKLLAALGALGGPVFVLYCVLFTTMAGGVFSLLILLAKKRFTSVVGGMVLDLYTQQVPGAYSNIRLPYAVPMAAGAVAALVFR
jgi:prepilin peptidase CpaA